MSRRLVPKYKIDRRLGVNLWGRPKSPVNTRPTKPGQHGRGGMKKKRTSNYGMQLAEKQKLQFYYGMKEKQFRTFFAKSTKSKANVAQVLIAMLEARLDAFVYRMKWAPTIFAAKQMVRHKHILVNGKVTSVPSYVLSTDDVVSLRETIKEHPKVAESMELAERQLPTYFEVSDNNKTGKFIKMPVLEEVPYPIKVNPHLIVEYYSRKL